MFTRSPQIWRKLNLELHHSKHYPKFCPHHEKHRIQHGSMIQPQDWPKGFPRWNDAKCKQTHSPLFTKSVHQSHMLNWNSRVSKLSLFTQRSHSSFIKITLEFHFSTPRFLRVQISKIFEKKLKVLKHWDSSHNEKLRVHPWDFNFSRI